MTDGGPCLYHQVEHEHEDRYYHEKIVKGLVQPAGSYLTRSQLHAVVSGRYRGDGRKVDAYVLYDPLDIHLEPQDAMHRAD